MHPRRVLAVSLLAVLVVLAGALPARADTASYVALGDSFAAGVGTRVYYDDGTTCYRSPRGYAAQVAARNDLSLTLAACSGATTADVLSTQTASLGTSTDYVTITAGGNDLGFTVVLTICALPGWLGNCTAAVGAALATVRTALPDRLAQVYRAVRARSPGARVVVTGYPRLFSGEDCSILTFFSTSDQRQLNAATDQLNAVIRQAALDAGLEFVDVAPTFSGHAWCDDAEWINGLSYPVINSFHPNLTGHRVFADLVSPALTGHDLAGDTAGESPASTRRSVSPAAVELPAGTQARQPSAITVPDLAGRDVARAAAAAGVTKAELRRLRVAQVDGTTNAALDRLDAEITRRAAARLAARR